MRAYAYNTGINTRVYAGVRAGVCTRACACMRIICGRVRMYIIYAYIICVQNILRDAGRAGEGERENGIPPGSR